jgi:hypothetical protein
MFPLSLMPSGLLCTWLSFGQVCHVGRVQDFGVLMKTIILTPILFIVGERQSKGVQGFKGDISFFAHISF